MNSLSLPIPSTCPDFFKELMKGMNIGCVCMGSSRSGFMIQDDADHDIIISTSIKPCWELGVPLMHPNPTLSIEKFSYIKFGCLKPKSSCPKTLARSSKLETQNSKTIRHLMFLVTLYMHLGNHIFLFF